jgi:hypothetical protein
MKYALLFVILIPFTLSAQFVKGDKFIGGSMGFNIQHSADHPADVNVSQSNSFSFRPEIGFFLTNNVAVGTELTYSIQSNKYTSFDDLVSENKTTAYGVSVFAKKFYSITDRFLFALSGKVRYARNTTNSISLSNSSDVSLNSVGGALSPTFIFFPSQRWGIEAGLGELAYWYGKYEGAVQGRHQLNFHAGLLSFGLKYYILKNRNE